MKKLLKEPLLHFLVLGAALFLVFDVVDNEVEVSEALSQEGGPRFISKEIKVSTELIDSLAARFSKTWQRSPSEDELKGLINEYVKEEIMYREALALELDQDDSIVRRRMRQQFEFFTQDLADLSEPTDEELAQYLESNPDQFRIDPVLTFKQVFLNPRDRSETIDADFEFLLSQLRDKDANADIREAGDRLMLESEFDSVPLSEVERLFGKEFCDGLSELNPGNWQGPVSSGYGVHIVLLSKRIEGRLPGLAEVRDQVLREVTFERRKAANEAIYTKWRAAYNVTIEELPPKPLAMAAK